MEAATQPSVVPMIAREWQTPIDISSYPHLATAENMWAAPLSTEENDEQVRQHFRIITGGSIADGTDRQQLKFATIAAKTACLKMGVDPRRHVELVDATAQTLTRSHFLVSPCLGDWDAYMGITEKTSQMSEYARRNEIEVCLNARLLLAWVTQSDVRRLDPAGTIFDLVERLHNMQPNFPSVAAAWKEDAPFFHVLVGPKYQPKTEFFSLPDPPRMKNDTGKKTSWNGGVRSASMKKTRNTGWSNATGATDWPKSSTNGGSGWGEPMDQVSSQLAQLPPTTHASSTIEPSEAAYALVKDAKKAQSSSVITKTISRAEASAAFFAIKDRLTRKATDVDKEAVTTTITKPIMQLLSDKQIDRLQFWATWHKLDEMSASLDDAAARESRPEVVTFEEVQEAPLPPCKPESPVSDTIILLSEMSAMLMRFQKLDLEFDDAHMEEMEAMQSRVDKAQVALEQHVEETTKLKQLILQNFSATTRLSADDFTQAPNQAPDEAPVQAAVQAPDQVPQTIAKVKKTSKKGYTRKTRRIVKDNNEDSADFVEPDDSSSRDSSDEWQP